MAIRTRLAQAGSFLSAQMVDSICTGNYEAGLVVLIKHVDLLFQRPS